MSKNKTQRISHQAAKRPAVPDSRRLSVEPPLLVFVSSVMRDMSEERETAKRAIESIPLARPWMFEYTPASADELEESYLSKVRDCDIFVLIVGRTDSEPVRNEYRTALNANKRILAFVQSTQRDASFQTFVDELNVKYSPYIQPDDLFSSLQTAVIDEVIRSYRRALRPSGARNLVSVVAPEVPADLVEPTLADDAALRSFHEIINYMAFGGNAPFFEPLLQLFGGREEEPALMDKNDEFEDIVFERLDDMQQTLQAVQRVIDRTVKSRGNRQGVFLEALKDEVAKRTSTSVVRQMMRAADTDQAVAVCKYMVLNVRRDIAPLIRLMQTAETLDAAETGQREKSEIVFRDVANLQAFVNAAETAQRCAGSDSGEYVRLVLEAGMRRALDNLPFPEQ